MADSILKKTGKALDDGMRAALDNVITPAKKKVDSALITGATALGEGVNAAKNYLNPKLTAAADQLKQMPKDAGNVITDVKKINLKKPLE